MPNTQATVSFMPYNTSARVGLLQAGRNARSRTGVSCQLAFLTRIYLLVHNTTQVPSDAKCIVEFKKAGDMKAA
jgi:hypothetical protein